MNFESKCLTSIRLGASFSAILAAYDYLGSSEELKMEYKNSLFKDCMDSHQYEPFQKEKFESCIKKNSLEYCQENLNEYIISTCAHQANEYSNESYSLSEYLLIGSAIAGLSYIGLSMYT